MSSEATWSGIELSAHTRSIGGELVRVVESQEQVATTQLVDTLAEQALLEALVERAKPPPRSGSAGLHYLLLTPFRYPPLPHGSRFGRRHEPSIFYASQSAVTALAETAWYRLLFWFGMETPPPRPIRSQHTLFGANYLADKGLQLQHLPFKTHQALLIDPADYSSTQALGTAMRAANILAFEFHSARDPDSGINIGLFEPAALASTSPSYQQEWLCETDESGSAFLNPSKRILHAFPIDCFWVGGTLPYPAS